MTERKSLGDVAQQSISQYYDCTDSLSPSGRMVTVSLTEPNVMELRIHLIDKGLPKPTEQSITDSRHEYTPLALLSLLVAVVQSHKRHSPPQMDEFRPTKVSRFYWATPIIPHVAGKLIQCMVFVGQRQESGRTLQCVRMRLGLSVSSGQNIINQ